MVQALGETQCRQPLLERYPVQALPEFPLALNSLAQNIDLNSLIESLPTTHFVSENDGTVIAKKGQDIFVKFKQGDWMSYPAQ
jgi:hypothetical protein